MNFEINGLAEQEEAARDLAYRRLAAYMLKLDVATLAEELRKSRLAAQPVATLPIAA